MRDIPGYEEVRLKGTDQTQQLTHDWKGFVFAATLHRQTANVCDMCIGPILVKGMMSVDILYGKLFMPKQKIPGAESFSFSAR